MKQLSIILLFSLILFPVIWNSISLFHYMIEHTHTFCVNETDHTHKTTEDCLSICQLNQDQLPQHLPVQDKYQELKLYLAPDLIINTTSHFIAKNVIFFEPSLLENPFSKDIFHPPIG